MNNENTWNLKTLYPSPTSDALHNDFVAFEKAIDALNSFSKSELKSYDNAKYKLENYINLLSNVCEYYKIGNYLSLQISANGKDYESIKLLDKFEEMTTSLTKPFTSFVKFIKEIDNLDEYISESYYLDDFSFLLHDIKLNSKYTLSEQEEIIIDKLKISGASSFEKLRDNTISSLRIHVDFDDKKQMLSFSEVRNLAYSHDPNIRKKSYEAELSSYKNIDDTVAVCLNSIKGWAITESNIRGYSSILDKTLIGSKMKKETFDAMMTSIQQSLPKLQQYFAHKDEKKLAGTESQWPQHAQQRRQEDWTKQGHVGLQEPPVPLEVGPQPPSSRAQGPGAERPEAHGGAATHLRHLHHWKRREEFRGGEGQRACGAMFFFFFFFFFKRSSPCAPVGIYLPFLMLSRAGPFMVRAGVL